MGTMRTQTVRIFTTRRAGGRVNRFGHESLSAVPWLVMRVLYLSYLPRISLTLRSFRRCSHWATSFFLQPCVSSP